MLVRPFELAAEAALAFGLLAKIANPRIFLGLTTKGFWPCTGYALFAKSQVASLKVLEARHADK